MEMLKDYVVLAQEQGEEIMKIVSSSCKKWGMVYVLQKMNGSICISNGKGMRPLEKSNMLLPGWRWKNFSDSGHLEDPKGCSWYSYDINTCEYDEREDDKCETKIFQNETRSLNVKEFKEYAEEKILEKAFDMHDAEYLHKLAMDFATGFEEGSMDGMTYQYPIFVYNVNDGHKEEKRRIYLSAEKRKNETDVKILLVNGADVEETYTSVSDELSDSSGNIETRRKARIEAILSACINLINTLGCIVYPFNVFDNFERIITDANDGNLETIESKIRAYGEHHDIDMTWCRSIEDLITALDNNSILFRTFNVLSLDEIRYLIKIGRGQIEMSEDAVEGYKKWLDSLKK